ncbi:MAG TPA: hypothetical protein VFE14_01590, partial [Micromonosporaceae bacterium]|nr:hypothetical protein [Micromonosporaceae bacterium]
AWLREQIDSTLDAQATALLKGDEKGFTAAADPGNAAVLAGLTLRYRSLRAMQISHWRPEVVGVPAKAAGAPDGQWTASLSVPHCFVVVTCEEDGLRLESRWVERGGTAYLVSLDASVAGQNGPRPWEVSELKAAVGTRVVVATTAKYASKLPTLLREAEKAATVADRFAAGGARPDRYRIFYAGSVEWKKWYNGNRPQWAAGYAVPTGKTHIDVVLNAAETPTTFLDDILRHEMSHAASLPGARYQDAKNWWLIEGLAEYAEMNGKAASQYDAVAAGAVRRFVHSGKWDGTVAVTEPADSAPLWEAGARYGVAFLAVRRLVDRYGERKMLDFFQAILHDGTDPATAAPQAFGAAWTSVEADCVSYIKRTAG